MRGADRACSDGWERECDNNTDALICGFFSRYAEMEAIQKNAISHRGRALQKLRAYLQPQGVASA